SSRRRHTRSKRDWSSDVCSSDLIYMSFKILKNLKYIWNYCINKKALFFIITFCLLGLIANGIIDSNVGTTIRHKLQYIFVIFLLYSVVSKIKLTSEKQHNNV